MKTELTNRLLQLSKDIFSFVKNSITIDPFNQNLIDHLLKSAWEMPLNYIQANSAVSKKAFSFKINQARSWLQEINHWLTLLGEINSQTPEMQILNKESHELNLIFNKISWKLKNSEKTEQESEVDDKE